MPAQRPRARIYLMQPNVPRIIEAILFLVTEAARRGAPLTQYDIVKTIFIADKAHLNKYGRPITFDNYVAMTHGPVPSRTYDILKENVATKIVLELPWSRRAAPEIGETCFAYEHPKRDASEDILSQTDFDELRTSLTVVKALRFSQIKRITHEDPAYVDAWDDESERAQFPMSYALLFDAPNDEKAEELSFYSRQI
jgi:uncharacterized phage-associated protein